MHRVIRGACYQTHGISWGYRKVRRRIFSRGSDRAAVPGEGSEAEPSCPLRPHSAPRCSESEPPRPWPPPRERRGPRGRCLLSRAGRGRRPRHRSARARLGPLARQRFGPESSCPLGPHRPPPCSKSEPPRARRPAGTSAAGGVSVVSAAPARGRHPQHHACAPVKRPAEPQRPVRHLQPLQRRYALIGGSGAHPAARGLGALDATPPRLRTSMAFHVTRLPVVIASSIALVAAPSPPRGLARRR
jgi:hypothetical protein